MKKRATKTAVKIKIWLLENGLKQNRIADEAGVTPCVVNFVVNRGHRNKAVIDAFLRHGCPAEYFKDPSPKMEATA